MKRFLPPTQPARISGCLAEDVLPATQPTGGPAIVPGPHRRSFSESGSTLPEILIAIVIIGTAVVALMSGLGAAAQVSDSRSKQTNANLIARNYAESLTNAVRVACSSSTANFESAIGYSPPSGYKFSTSPTQWEYDASTGVRKAVTPFGACPAPASYYEIDATFASNDGRSSESLTTAVFAP